MVRITETSEISDYEANKFKKEDDILMIGKSDKSINVISAGNKIKIKELAVANRTGTSRGTIDTPTEEGIPFIIQYGVSEVSQNTTVDISLDKPMPNRIFQVQVTLNNMTDDVSTIKASVTDRTKFSIKRIGGTNREFVSWFVIGF